MKEISDGLQAWHSAGTIAAIARVVGIEGSGPRLPGSAMAVSATGEVIGSVSGGCVEGAVVLEAIDVIEQGVGRVVRFGFSDDDAFAVGLTCGGIIDLFIEPFDYWPLLESLRDDWAASRPVGLATVIAGPNVGAKLVVDSAGEARGSLGDADLDRVAARDATGELAAGTSAIRHYGPCGQADPADLDTETVTVFVESFAPPPQMLIFGAVDFTAALARVAKVIGFNVTVCDARETFATTKRFPMADEVVVDWPHRLLERVGKKLGPADAICVLTHDHKFDVPAIISALATEVGYVGAMGSRRTHQQRVEKLQAEGVGEADLARLMAPIGLDLGARTPEETAVSICAEIIATRTGKNVPSLSSTTGSIH